MPFTQNYPTFVMSNAAFLKRLFFSWRCVYVIFCLKVFDVGNEVPEALLNQYPSTEAHINVEVVLRPKIDVFPASTTLVKSQVMIGLSSCPAKGHQLFSERHINEQFREIYE